MTPSIRSLYLYVFAATVGIILTALYMQHSMGLEPCYLCIVQRAFIILTGFIALSAFIHNPKTKGHKIYASAMSLSSLTGGGFSIRQLWLQQLPEDKVPACGPPADYLFEALPIVEALPMLLRGDGNCAEIQWTLLGLSIPGWTLLAFTGLTLMGVYQLLRKR